MSVDHFRSKLNASENVRKFKSQFKAINHATIKQRHDNFSFEKAIESRPFVYDTV
jgi:hypothetical protein